MRFEVQVENCMALVFFHSVDTAASVDGHLRSHHSLLMEWPNNSWIAPAADFEHRQLLSLTVPLHARIFFQIHPTRLYGFGHSLVSVDCHWCPMATTTVAREHEYSSAFRKEGSRGCERVRGVKGAMAKGWRGRILTKERWWGLKERERDRDEREIDNGYAMVFRFFTMFAPNARSWR